MCVYNIYTVCIEGGRGVYIAQRTASIAMFFVSLPLVHSGFVLGVAGFYSPPPPPPTSVFVVTFVFAFIVFKFCWCVF